MPEGLIVQQCAPTLAGVKTASLFTCDYETKEELMEQVRSLNRRLASKGLCMIVLGYPKEGRALIYLFRPARLRKELREEVTEQILRERGYEPGDMGKCIGRLITKLKDYAEFPHEIGCFLGYPPEDVIGFIENRECKAIGVWKVYGDAEKAMRIFQMYRKCTDAYTRGFEKGMTLERLAAAV